MNLLKPFVILLTILASCGPKTETIPCAAEQTDQTGVYYMRTTEIAGDCGSMGSIEAEIEDGVVYVSDGAGCVLSAVDWKANQCSTLSKFDCDDGTWIMHLEWVVTSVPEEADRLVGVLYAQMDKWSGIYTCSGHYTFEASKIGELN
tara:strand:+ start:1609 stop:2049 length:441 start_codon:yes stop_codon:yes gene_type:complete